MKNNKRGLFIVIDGLDCTGKTTLIKEVCKKLKQRKVKYLDFKEPELENGYQYINMRLKETNIKLLNEWLDEGLIVICDRYWGSTFAYNTEVPLDYFIKKYELGVKPDYEFIIKDDLQKINLRLIARGEPEMTEEEYERKTQLYYMYAGLTNVDRTRTQIMSRKWVERSLERVLGGWWWK